MKSVSDTRFFFLKKIFCAKFVYIMYADKIRRKHI